MIIVGATWTLSGRLSTIEQKQTYIDMSFRELSDANKDLAKAVTRLTAVAEERARQESLMQKRGSTTPKRTGE